MKIHQRPSPIRSSFIDVVATRIGYPHLQAPPNVIQRPQFISTNCFRYYTVGHQAQSSKPGATFTKSRNILIPSLVLASSLPIGLYLHQSANMSSKLIPSNPSDVMVIRNITQNVVTFSVPFSRFGILQVGGRGTVVRLTSGNLAVISPVAMTPEVKAKLAELAGTVAYIIAPDFEHHIFISEWAKEYPGAKIIGPEGLPEKRAKANDEKIGKEPFTFVYDPTKKQFNDIDTDFAANFEVEYVDSHPNKEIVLFFKPEKILIQADLMFNLPAIEQYSRVPEAAKNNGIANRLWNSIQTTNGEAKGTKRLIWYGLSAKNREGWNESMRRIDAWDFNTIIPCHGETMEGNGKELFRKIFEWHLQGHK
ncbi:beta-lactamase-like protein [Pseudomassariella vexata]|uniref:Beta-lactamase-like protein n=1 Tax=Pseudomassariella vexata TaxID=1141098 RepID=A0A1Y2E9U6_9PEZI|nr:beta-lactamase-like protein [Pseudomassariella vexata]ORY67635.1 beta-lactamase-like protein [Pseudomassariella vexata]